MKNNNTFVIGENVKKSLSPLIFNYWFSKYSIKGKYDYLETKKENFENKIKEKLKNSNICGFNVTIPFKEKIVSYLDSVDEHSKKIGAVNCVTVKGNNLYGSNTDWIGYYNTLKEKTKKQTRVNSEAIIIGYGGAAKAVLYALLRLEYKKIHVFNRTTEKLQAIKNNKIETHSILEISKYIKSSKLITNTTPTNVLKKLNISKTLPQNVIISDLVYRPLETDFLKFFKNPQHKTYGISMLINQAVPCFKKWFDITPVVDEELLEIVKKELNS